MKVLWKTPLASHSDFVLYFSQMRRTAGAPLTEQASSETVFVTRRENGYL